MRAPDTAPIRDLGARRGSVVASTATCQLPAVTRLSTPGRLIRGLGRRWAGLASVCGARALQRFAFAEVFTQGHRQPVPLLLLWRCAGLGGIFGHDGRNLIANIALRSSTIGRVVRQGSLPWARCLWHRARLGRWAVAAVAQGQSTSLVRTGSVVQFHSAAPLRRDYRPRRRKPSRPSSFPRLLAGRTMGWASAILVACFLSLDLRYGDSFRRPPDRTTRRMSAIRAYLTII